MGLLIGCGEAVGSPVASPEAEDLKMYLATPIIAKTKRGRTIRRRKTDIKDFFCFLVIGRS